MKIYKKVMLKYVVLMLLLAGNFSCQNIVKSDATENVTGTVIGNYSNGFFSLLIQVDEKYPIGKTIEYAGTSGDCRSMPHSGTYRNMIQVQPLSEPVLGKKISFSYRSFKTGNDDALFIIGSGIGNTLCGIPDVPIYVIIDYQILN